ncbi:S8 family serine peptidase [Streptomyces sp. NPDC001581]|uniref:S8 family peptidase n=1 Tax=Streptomyces sp. NPDC001581 TaxID=3154386 RepID=UPI0033300D8A
MRRVVAAALAGIAVLATSAFSAEASEARGAREKVPLVQADGESRDGVYLVAVREDEDPRKVAASLGVTPRHVFTGVYHGFSVKTDAHHIEAMRDHPEKIRKISENHRYRTMDDGARTPIYRIQTQDNPGSGLDRIDQRDLPLDRKYQYQLIARGMYAYVIDTGIDTDHPEFGGRAINVFDADGEIENDCEGHGTHVAGIIGSDTYGVAKRIDLRGVKVTDGCGKTASPESVLAGMEYVYNYGIQPAVVNMSLGGDFDPEVSLGAARLATRFFVAAAAGNDRENACFQTPAGVPSVLTVGASSHIGGTDRVWEDSASGPCVDLYAPGNFIRSTLPNTPTDRWTNGLRSGTSMATPFATGVAAIVLAHNPTFTPQNLHDWLTGNGTRDRLTGVPAFTPNVLLHKGRL